MRLIWPLLLLPLPAVAQELRTSVQSGNWSNRNTWDCFCVPEPEDHAIIKAGHTVNFVATNQINDLTIEAGAILGDNGHTNTVTGNLHVDGILAGSGNYMLNGIGKSISGTGVISNTGNITISGDKNILAGSNLVKNAGNITLSANTTIRNSGKFSAGGNLNGTDNTSIWINDMNSSVSVAGSFMATGVLHASSTGNTVIYSGVLNSASACNTAFPCQSVRYPVSGVYYHLVIAGLGTVPKRLITGNFTILGDLTIYSLLDAQSRNIDLKGNWISEGGVFESASTQIVSFTGDQNQDISALMAQSFNNLTINKTGAGKSVIINTTDTVRTNLSLVNGVIVTGSKRIVVGRDAANVGNITRTNGYVVGHLERWISSITTPSPPVLFPVGTPDHYRPAVVTLNNVFAPGTLLASFSEDYPGNSGLPLTDGTVTQHNTFNDGFWKLTPLNGLTSTNLDLAVTGNGFTGFVDGVGNPDINNNTRLLSRLNSGSAWTLNGSHVPYASGYTVRRSSLTLLPGEFALGNDRDCAPPVAQIISGSVSVCAGTTGVQYSIAEEAGNSYHWEVTGGTIITDPSLHEIVVDWGMSGIAGWVSVAESNACAKGPTNLLAVDVHSIPPPSISGKQNVPEHGAAQETYSITPLPGYAYTWSVTGNGDITGGQGTSSITVLWGDEGQASVNVFAEYAGCGISNPAVLPVTIYKVIFSNRTSGNWSQNISWTCNCQPGQNDNVVIRAGHTITVNQSNTRVNHLTIDAGGALNTGNQGISVYGDVNLNGTLLGNGTFTLLNSASNPVPILDGIGTNLNAPVMIQANRTILPTALLNNNSTASNSFRVASNATVTNYGSIRFLGTLDDVGTASTWINGAGAVLKVGGGLFSSGGTLDASAEGNSVWYISTPSITLANVKEAQYYDLVIEGDRTKQISTTGSPTIRVSHDFINNGIFVPNSGTVLFNGVSEVSGSSITTFHNVQLESGHSLKFPDQDVMIRGHVTFGPGSTFDPSLGRIVLSGTTDQSISTNGSPVYNLQINKAGGSVSVNSLLPLLSMLDIVSPTTLNTNDHLLVRSRGITTDLDGSIGPVHPSAAINGHVTVERYMNPIGRTFRYLASPVENALPPAVLGSTMYSWKYVSDQGNWYTQPSSLPWEMGEGYSVRIPDGSAQITWAVQGPVHKGEFSWALNEEGWHLIGNPYASATRWFDSGSAWELSNIASTIAVTDNTVEGYPNYFRYWNFDIEDSPDWGAGFLENGVVAMAQAFWVYAGEGGGTLKINEPAKAGAVDGRFYRKKQTLSQYLVLTLRSERMSDRAFLKLNPEASEEFELEYDAVKLWNGEMDIFFVDKDQRSLLMHAIPELPEDLLIPIRIQLKEPGLYVISVSNVENFAPSTEFFLFDRLKMEYFPLGAGTGVPVILTQPDLTVTDRFFLTRKPEGDAAKPEEKMQIWPNPVVDFLNIDLPSGDRYRAVLYDLQGRVLKETVMQGLNQLDFRDFSRGLYLLKVTNGARTWAHKLLK